MKIRILVCSESKYFVNSFSSYVMERKDTEFQFSFFTDKQAALEYLENQMIEGILADEDFWTENILSDKYIRICISDKTRVRHNQIYHELNIYQRGISILEDLRVITTGIEKREEALAGNRQKIISFYSPQGGTGKTTLAYICAMLCAKKGSSAYLNMEEFGFVEHLYQTNFMVSMEEILLAIKNGRDFMAKLSNIIVRDKRNVSVFPIMKNINDFLDMTEDNVEVLIKGFLEAGHMDYLFVDMTGGLSACNKKIMELSDIVFWVFNDDITGIGKMERIKSDQSIQDAENYAKSYFIINKSRLKVNNVSAIRIPFSKSMSQEADLETVLSGNRDFYLSCMEMIKMIDR